MLPRVLFMSSVRQNFIFPPPQLLFQTNSFVLNKNRIRSTQSPKRPDEHPMDE